MKPFTSWSRQEAGRGKCPKRFYLGYLEPSGLTHQFRKLKSVRELGGHLVHESLAEVIRGIADGKRISDYPDAGERALEHFDRIVSESAALPPWTIVKNLQVAELHNGAASPDEIAHWREIIPLCVANGLRVMHSFSLRSDAGERRMEAERKIRFQKASREHRCVIDVLIRDGKNLTIIDWKCHQITNTDIAQVRFYQDFLSTSENIPASRLHGFAVDLRREEIIEVPYRPHQLLGDSKPNSAPRLFDPARNPYPARPSEENCARCPFAAVCSESVIRPPQSICLLGGTP